MATSLFLLLDDLASVLDDVAGMTKVAATKTAGVVGDDLALNAKQLVGIASRRELPVVARVAAGSLRNKAILVPAALTVSGMAPWAIRPLLMAGGVYLCFEGVEKILHGLTATSRHDPQQPGATLPEPSGDAGRSHPDHQALEERRRIAGAIRTDFILSAEIIVISLGIVANAPLMTQVLVLAAIALGLTAGVYGLVAVIVRLDDLGAVLAGSRFAVARHAGWLCLMMAPWLLRSLSLAGTAAMFVVGGGILIEGFPVVAHAVEETMHERLPAGVAGAASLAIHAIVGLAAGGIAVVVVSAVRNLAAAVRRT